MNPTVKVRNISIGDGKPKICVPVTETNCSDIWEAAAALETAPCDLAEWRADHFEKLTDPAEFTSALKMLRMLLNDIPLLFTIRTDEEGGTIRIQTEDYISLNLAAIQSGYIDLVDVELSRGDDCMRTIASAAHQAGVRVIGSRHDFQKTPSKEEIVMHLCRMQKLGADIAKFAVMPQTERDVLTLLDATLTMKEEHNGTPVVTMSMGSRGVISRIAGGIFGSCITFGTVGKASAPGQISASLLKTFLGNI